jgi:hypothetical protein
MVAAIVNRAQRRLAGGRSGVGSPACKAARHQIERIQKQLRRIGEKLQPEQGNAC